MDGVEAHGGDFVGAMGHGPLPTFCDDTAVVSLITSGQLAIG
ncbi:MAG: Uncharacterised protein [Halieaceae bacterium]|nr:MAG: Uncharacterised protein [Halieaceae bacterium]